MFSVAKSDGWLQEEKVKLYSNGPLPNRFENEAHFSPDGSEFALPADTSKLFISWCLESQVEVTGFDVWLNNPLDNTIFDELGIRGDAGHCLSEIDRALNNSEILKYNRPVLFNIRTSQVI